jgi:DNA-binding NarL/FixJ family response regulator
MKKIRVFIVDDHELVVVGIKTTLSIYPDIEVVGEAYNPENIKEKLIKSAPDILLLDVHLPGKNGIEVAKEITNSEMNVKIIFLTSTTEKNIVIEAFESGAMGYLSKAYKPDELQTAIRTVYNGDKYIKGEIAQIILDNYFQEKQNTLAGSSPDMLSEHEKEIIKLISKGLLNKEIADKLNVSLRTIEGHRNQIMKKLNLKNTAEIVVFAIKNNIISI